MSMADDQFSPAAASLAEHHVQREVGDGNSEWADEDFDSQSVYGDDGESSARTTFFHWDTELPKDADRDKWRRLAIKNYKATADGKKAFNSRKWKAGKINDAKLFCDHLNFGQEKTDLIVEMARNIDFDTFGNYTTEQVLVAACSLVEDRDTTNFEDRIITRDEFKELMEVNDMGSREYRSIRQAIRDRTEYF